MLPESAEEELGKAVIEFAASVTGSYMAGKRRHFSAEDEERGIVPSALKRLGRERQKEYMRYWFRRNFEDPANETPFSREDGGYLYIWGGPYNARDELYKEFGNLVPEGRIEDIAAEVEHDGSYDWAPGPDHPDHGRAQEEWYAEHGSDDEAPPEQLGDIIARLEAGLRPTYGNASE